MTESMQDTATTCISSVVLEVPEPSTAEDFYASAFDLGRRVEFRASEATTSGFRGFTMSLVVSQPGNADLLLQAANAGGATTVKPAKKSVWGYGGVVQAPDGAIWKVATSSKKDTGPAARDVRDVVLLLGVADIGASKRFYVERGLRVAKSFAKYVQFDVRDGVKLALYSRRALAKDAGVQPQGAGSHRMVVRGDLGSFTDPDGFTWEAV